MPLKHVETRLEIYMPWWRRRLRPDEGSQSSAGRRSRVLPRHAIHDHDPGVRYLFRSHSSVRPARADTCDLPRVSARACLFALDFTRHAELGLSLIPRGLRRTPGRHR